MDWNELQSLTWPGYARKNGGKGIRNRVLVIYTVKCAEFVAQQIVAKSGSTNVELLGLDGCNLRAGPGRLCPGGDTQTTLGLVVQGREGVARLWDV